MATRNGEHLPFTYDPIEWPEQENCDCSPFGHEPTCTKSDLVVEIIDTVE